MKVTYTYFPLLLFTSYDKETAPTNLPFEMQDELLLSKVSKSKSFNQFIAYFAVKNSLDNKNTSTNYYLTDSTFDSVEYDNNFRNFNYRYFQTNYITPRRGCIMFKEGGTYVYVLLSVQESKTLFNVDGRYMATAYFKGNFFLGFEECVINQKGLGVMPTGIYMGNMDPGDYLSFASVVLGYADGKSKKLHAPDVKEVIIEL